MLKNLKRLTLIKCLLMLINVQKSTNIYEKRDSSFADKLIINNVGNSWSTRNVSIVCLRNSPVTVWRKCVYNGRDAGVETNRNCWQRLWPRSTHSYLVICTPIRFKAGTNRRSIQAGQFAWKFLFWNTLHVKRAKLFVENHSSTWYMYIYVDSKSVDL